MSRLFFALDISTEDKAAIAYWRAQQLQLPFKAINQSNFHITLSFLGQVSLPQQAALINSAENISTKIKETHQLESPPLLSLDYYSLLTKPKVLFIGNSHCPLWLSQLAEQLSLSAQVQNITQERLLSLLAQ